MVADAKKREEPCFMLVNVNVTLNTKTCLLLEDNMSAATNICYCGFINCVNLRAYESIKTAP